MCHRDVLLSKPAWDAGNSSNGRLTTPGEIIVIVAPKRWKALFSMITVSSTVLVISTTCFFGGKIPVFPHRFGEKKKRLGFIHIFFYSLNEGSFSK